MTPLTLSYHDADFDKTRYIIVSTPNGIQMLELCDQDPAIDGHIPHVLQMLPWIPKLWQSALWFVHHISLTDLSIVIMHVHGGITVPMGSEFNISTGE